MPSLSKFSILVIVSLALLSSCGCAKEIDGKAPWTVELNKGSCMDVCVSYQITIEHDGQFTYKGIQNVKHIGEKSGTISDKDMDSFLAILDSTYWNDFSSEYGSPGAGSQRKELVFTSKSTHKKVVYYRVEPQQIRKLENFIDQLIDSDDL